MLYGQAEQERNAVANIFTEVIASLRPSRQQKCGTTVRSFHHHSVSQYRVETCSQTHLPVKPLKE